MSMEFSSGGSPPEPSRVVAVAGKMEDSFNKYKDMISRLSLSQDFQALEYYALTVSNLKRENMVLSDIEDSVQWQINSMKAFATGQSPPIPNAKTMEMMQKKSGGSMSSPPTIVSTPFTGREACFEVRL